MGALGLLSRPVTGAWLAALRTLFGGIMAASMGRFLAYGWVERFFISPRFHFKYWGLGFVEPLAAPGMMALFWALLALAVCMGIGLCFRPSAALFALGLGYVQALDVSTYLNHYYLAVLLSLLLCISPAGRVWSVDAALLGAWAKRRARLFPSPSARGEIASLWLYLFRYQVGLVYCFAGLAKLNSDWLVHAQPLRIWLGARTELPLLGPVLTIEWVPLAMSWAGFLFDSTIPFWLSFRRTRRGAYVVLLVFHAMTSLLFPIGMFPLIMTVLALVFFPPDWPLHALGLIHSIRDGLVRHSREGARSSGGNLDRDNCATAVPIGLALGPHRLTVHLLLLYCLVQLLLPLRFAFYGGNVSWHEQGMRFSWRVMLRAKGGGVDYVVRDRASGEELHVPPRRYLTKFQESELSGQPDLILQLAHHIAGDYARRGRDVAVFATARSNLNGRRAEPLVDPAIDLTQVEDGLFPARFILPAPTSPPPKSRPVR